MFWRTVRHEWRLLLADRTPMVALAIFVVLGGYAAVDGVERARAEQALASNATREAHQSLQRVRERIADEAAPTSGPSRASSRAAYGPQDPEYVLASTRTSNVVRRPSPYGALSAGRGQAIPTVYSVMTLEVAISPYGDAQLSPGSAAIFGRAVETVGNPLTRRGGALDLVFILVYVCPLVIIALAYDLLAAEREQGTLAFVLAQPVPLWRMLTAKVFVRGTVVLAPPIVLAVGAMHASTGLAGPDVMPRLLVWSALTVVYAGCWFLLAVFVNAAARGSGANAVALVVAWIGTVVVLPALAAIVADARYPVPSSIELANQARVGRNDARATANEEELRRAFLERHNADFHDQATAVEAMRSIVEDGPVGSPVLDGFFERHPEVAGNRRFTNTELFYVSLAAQEEHVERETQALRDRTATMVAARHKWMDGAAVILPPLLVERSLRDVTETGYRHYRRFFDHVARYQTAQRAFFWPRVARTAPLDRRQADLIPVFTYEPEPTSAVVGRGLARLGLLLCVLAVMVAATAVGYGRFKAVA